MKLEDLELLHVEDFFATQNRLKRIQCVQIFDSGYRNIYILDDSGKFTGHAITKHSMWEPKVEVCIPFLVDDNFKHIGEKLHSYDKIVHYSEQIFNENHDIEEIPIVNSTGEEILAVITKCRKRGYQNYGWRSSRLFDMGFLKCSPCQGQF